MPADRSEHAALDGIFPCLRYGTLTHRACMRRQVERNESIRPGVEGPPMKPWCAERCEQGREVRALFPALVIRACRTCGTGLVGVKDCPTCAARAAEKTKKPPQGALPPREPSTHIWDPAHIEPDFVPPAASPAVPHVRAPAPTAARLVPAAPVSPEDRFAAADEERRRQLDQVLAQERCRYCEVKLSDESLERHPGVCGKPQCQRRARKEAAAAAPTTASGEGEEGPTGRAGNAAPSPPPRPQPKEETMPKDEKSIRYCKNCKTKPLRSDNESGICSKCRIAPEKGRAAGAAAAPPPVKASRPAPARAAARVLRTGPRGDDDGFDLGAATVDQLIALIAGCQEELRNRKAEVAEQLAAIEKAIGSAAA